MMTWHMIVMGKALVAYGFDQGSTEPLISGGCPLLGPNGEGAAHLAEVSISRGQPPPTLDSAGGTWPAKLFKLKLCQKARQRQSTKLSPKGQC